MNTKLDKIEGVIYYDSEKELYNFPYTLEFTNEKINLDFIFHIENYKNQNEMLIDRNEEISKQILHNYFFKQFERVQEICLSDTNNEELIDEVNERLDVMYYLFIVIMRLNRDIIREDNEIIDTVWSLYDELLEMFVLLEDFYSGVRKTEFLERKKKYLELENKNK